jgi:hypothetical protein
MNNFYKEGSQGLPHLSSSLGSLLRSDPERKPHANPKDDLSQTESVPLSVFSSDNSTSSYHYALPVIKYEKVESLFLKF